MNSGIYGGVPHAAIMTELGLALEEYYDFLKQYPHGEKCFCIGAAIRLSMFPVVRPRLERTLNLKSRTTFHTRYPADRVDKRAVRGAVSE